MESLLQRGSCCRTPIHPYFFGTRTPEQLCVLFRIFCCTTAIVHKLIHFPRYNNLLSSPYFMRPIFEAFAYRLFKVASMTPSAGELPHSQRIPLFRFKRTKFHAQPADGRVRHSGPVHSGWVLNNVPVCRQRKVAPQGTGGMWMKDAAALAFLPDRFNSFFFGSHELALRSTRPLGFNSQRHSDSGYLPPTFPTALQRHVRSGPPTDR